MTSGRGRARPSPIFEQALAPLIEPGYLRIVYGGAEIGAYAAEHRLVDEVHITGSIQAHEAIVWGPAGPERARRKAAGDPPLNKPITSELGNVSPWVIVPGPYSERQLSFQAENLAASVINNASFNCVASKLVVTCRDWSDRAKFLDMVEAVLRRTPPRTAYYPGAGERYARFANSSNEEAPTNPSDGTLPWSLARDVNPDCQPHWFREESFAPVFAETALDADSPEQFLDRAVDFCNDRVWGTLGATLVVHPTTRRAAEASGQWERAIARLRYGTVGINHWSALAYAVMCTPWGGYPGGTLAEPESGIGWVHNTYMLDGVEKTVFEGPLTVWPKPLWFPTHRTAHLLAPRVVELYRQPAV